MGSGALEGDIEKPLILRGCEPFALVTADLNQIEKYLTAVEIGILPCQCAVDGEIGRPARGLQSILSISFIGAAMLDQKIFTKRSMELSSKREFEVSRTHSANAIAPSHGPWRTNASAPNRCQDQNFVRRVASNS